MPPKRLFQPPTPSINRFAYPKYRFDSVRLVGFHDLNILKADTVFEFEEGEPSLDMLTIEL